jgi:gentisate 1,2-dioxygenase
MTANPSATFPVRLRAEDRPGRPLVNPELVELYQGFEKALFIPLRTGIGDLMPLGPRTRAQPHRWQWKRLLELADRAGELVPFSAKSEASASRSDYGGLNLFQFSEAPIFAKLNLFRSEAEGGVW